MVVVDRVIGFNMEEPVVPPMTADMTNPAHALSTAVMVAPSDDQRFAKSPLVDVLVHLHAWSAPECRSAAEGNAILRKSLAEEHGMVAFQNGEGNYGRNHSARGVLGKRMLLLLSQRLTSVINMTDSYQFKLFEDLLMIFHEHPFGHVSNTTATEELIRLGEEDYGKCTLTDLFRESPVLHEVMVNPVPFCYISQYL